jgi:hypothetical protein
MQYHHKQIGFFIIIPLIVVFIIVFAQLMATGVFHFILILILIFFFCVLTLFYALTIEIQDNIITCRFGIGLIQKRISLSEIETVKAVQNPWYAGWGIRWIPGQYWLWNVSGFEAVELYMKDGKKFRIGTDEPEALVRAIESNKKIEKS